MTTTLGASRAMKMVPRIAMMSSVCALVILTACGGKKDTAASQTAAKVNKEEITVHQINFVLQQQRGLKPEQAEAASRQVLERLIDQELAVQKAEDMKLDRDPRVLQALEAAKREVIARAYAERVSEGAGKPTADDVQKYYEAKPALFKDRHVYNVQEVQVEAKPEELAELRAKAEASKNAAEFVEYLKSRDIKYRANQVVRAPEQLPPAALQLLASMKEGELKVHPTATGLQLVYLAGVRAQPVSLQQATPVIEQLIVAERKRELIAKNVAELRRDAKIEYVGKFQMAAASAPAAATAASEPLPTIEGSGTAEAPGTPAVPVAAAAEPPASAASGHLDNASIMKGLGIK